MNYLSCKPREIDSKCQNCKRLNTEAQAYYVNLKNSKSKACIYIPISLQKP